MPCLVPGCTGAEMLFPIPVMKEKRRQWVEAIRGAVNAPFDASVVMERKGLICMAHFQKNEIIRTKTAINLIPNAVPSIFEEKQPQGGDPDILEHIKVEPDWLEEQNTEDNTEETNDVPGPTCDTCEILFSPETFFRLSCQLCEAVITSSEELRTHIQRNHLTTIQVDEEISFPNVLSIEPSPGSSYPVSSSTSNCVSIKQEETTARQEKKLAKLRYKTPKIIKCSLCKVSKVYKSPSQLMDHRRNEHKNSHYCAKCFRLFSNVTSCKNHQLKEHSSDKYKCRYCKMMFSDYSAIFNHIESEHNREFTVDDYLVIQLDVLSDNGHNQSDQVAKAKKKEVQKQVATTKDMDEPGVKAVKLTPSSNGSIFPGQAIRRTARLFDLTPSSFSCPKCQKEKFDSVKHFMVHCMSQHFDMKVCSMCFDLFAFERDYNQHLMTSHADDRYQCVWCKKLFKLLSSISSHIKNDHNATFSFADLRIVKLIVISDREKEQLKREAILKIG